jgi:hypothetical protein
MQCFHSPVIVACFKIDIGQIVVSVGDKPAIANTLRSLELLIYIVERLRVVADLKVNAGDPSEWLPRRMLI